MKCKLHASLKNLLNSQSKTFLLMLYTNYFTIKELYISLYLENIEYYQLLFKCHWYYQSGQWKFRYDANDVSCNSHQ